MDKRPFERSGGVLVDHFEEPPGKRCTVELPASMLGEGLEPGVREASLETIAAGGPGSGSAIRALRDERSPELLEALLSAVAGGDIAAPMRLLTFRGDPRVEPAILEAGRRQAAETLANVAQVLGLMGGAEAVKVLEERLSALAVHPELMHDDAFFNDLAGSATAVAEAQLRLRPDHVSAAQLLVRLCGHPCSFNRQTALRAAVGCVRGLQTEAEQVLRAALEPLLAAPSADEFLLVAPVFWRTATERIRERWERVLSAPDQSTRERALWALASFPNDAAAWAALIRWLPSEPSLRLAVQMLSALGPLAPAELRSHLVARGLEHESPSLRLDAIGLLQWVQGSERAELARRSAATEPDAALLKQLERVQSLEG